MPLCEGRPDGPCPTKANNASVKSTQGDLFLCKSCDDYRFGNRSSATSARTAGKDTGPPDTRRAISSATAIKSKPVPTRQTRNSASSAIHAVSDAVYSDASAVITDVTVHKPGKSVTNDDCIDVNCPVCLESAEDRPFTCDICHVAFHGPCTGLSEDVCKVFVTIIDSTGWVCRNCRTVMGGRVVNLQTAVTKTNEELADMRTIMAELKRDLDSVKDNQGTSVTADLHWPSLAAASSSSSSSSTSSGAAAANLSPQQFVSLEVHKTVKDISRRKCNVVITGLRESSGTDNSQDADTEAFLQLCEDHLSIKPALAPQGCRRLGQRTDQHGRPRRLLVHLRSESCAADLLLSAKQLRRSDDPDVARHVYINADLTPVEAKLAYEERQRRRERRERRTNTDSHQGNSNTSNRAVATNQDASDIRSHDQHRDTIDSHSVGQQPFPVNT